MKTIEQKAKAYDEALKWMRELYPGLHGATKEDAERYFPELRESEDERTRKELVNFLQSPFIKENLTDEKVAPWLAYLEKQKEQKPADISGLRDWKFIVDAVLTEREGIGQYLDNPETERIAKKLQERFSLPQSKPAEWSKEDSIHLANAILSAEKEWGAESCTAKWLEFLPERFNLQPKQEWSEEDQLNLNWVIAILNGEPCDLDIQLESLISWLKSLRPSWKPSEDEERLINTSISFLKDFADKGYENAAECIDWLKSKLNGNTCK